MACWSEFVQGLFRSWLGYITCRFWHGAPMVVRPIGSPHGVYGAMVPVVKFLYRYGTGMVRVWYGYGTGSEMPKTLGHLKACRFFMHFWCSFCDGGISTIAYIWGGKI